MALDASGCGGTNQAQGGSIELLGALAFLAAHCPLHKDWTAARLKTVFEPALKRQAVRIFRNTDGLPCAALVWARLSADVADAVLTGKRALQPDDWASGDQLWFMDLIAPFGHAGQVARSIARTPPKEPFHFARVGPDGTVRKIVNGDAAAKRGHRLQVRTGG